MVGLAFVAAFTGRRALVRLTGAFAAVVALAYLPHVIVVGLDVVGYLPGYLQEERYGEGGRYLLAGLLGLPPALTAALAAAALAGAAGWVLVRRPEVPRGSAVLLGALLLAVTPVQPWYAVTLLAVATVAAARRGRRWPWPATPTSSPSYSAPYVVAIGRVSYGPALAVLLAAR